MHQGNIRSLRTPIAQTFGGLWLCPRVNIDTENDRAAMLFLRGKDLDYMLQWNREVIDPAELEEDDDDIFTHPWLTEIRVTPTSIHKHLAGCEHDDFDVDVAWRVGKDGMLIIDFGTCDAFFQPTTFEEIYRFEFQRDIVEETLEQIKELGLVYELKPRIPVFPR